jgi:hypothetical protein
VFVEGDIQRERKVVFGVFEWLTWLTIWQMFEEGLA